jgi:uncharacterized caspase-like protein
MIDGQFYIIPYDFDTGSRNKSIKSAVSASEFAKKVQALGKYGKVLLLLDACHSGAVGAQGWATDPDEPTQTVRSSGMPWTSKTSPS